MLFRSPLLRIRNRARKRPLKGSGVVFRQRVVNMADPGRTNTPGPVASRSPLARRLIPLGLAVGLLGAFAVAADWWIAVPDNAPSDYVGRGQRVHQPDRGMHARSLTSA